MSNYKTPTNKAEYWTTVDMYWDDLFSILQTYLFVNLNKWIDQTDLPKTLEDYLLELKETKNPKLARAFNAAWYNIPEEKVCEEIPAWAQFYDLCTKDKLAL
jgi:hypothetical protein